MQIVSWLGAHWVTISVVIAGLLSALGTVKNLLSNGKHPEALTWIGRVMDVLAWVAAHGSEGLPGTRLSLPGIPSREAK